ncbi:nucleotidyltransferase family protein [Paenibacillus aurantiacus]|uniref:Nucleotidyltransferase family protein n=1 Tax=Paenibacillus aurantiacus TaxID=1936118 RepID=A0ABV5KIL4_9BACL
MHTSLVDDGVFSAELRLLLALVRPESPKAQAADASGLEGQIDWQLFGRLVRHHRLFPYLQHRIKNGSASGIPEDVLRELRLDYRQNVIQMLHLSGEMALVGRALEEAGIRCIFLKGPVVAHELYGDIALRTSNDLDAIVPIGELDAVQRLLQRMGYIKDDYILSVLNDWKWRHHHITFIHPLKRVKLEIHWRLNPGPSKEPAFDELWARSRLRTWTSYPVRMLGAEDLFLFLASHGARHGWSRLRWLLDIDRMARGELAADTLVPLLKRNHLRDVGGQALALAKGLLGTAIPPALAPLAERPKAAKLARGAMFYIGRMVNLHNKPLPPDVDRYHKRHLFEAMSAYHKMLFLLSFLFPYPQDTQTLPLPRSLHVLYFPLRPLLWIWRKARRQEYPA